MHHNNYRFKYLDIAIFLNSPKQSMLCFDLPLFIRITLNAIRKANKFSNESTLKLLLGKTKNPSVN